MSTSTHPDVVELDVTGMTCAACAARIERRLNKLDGVTATVNYATERASVSMGNEGVAVPDLVGAVTSLGYGASVHADQHEERSDQTDESTGTDDGLSASERA